MNSYESHLARGVDRWDLTTCANCGDVTHRGAVDKDDLCPDCHEFNEEGLL